MLIGLPYLENKFIKIMINRRYQTNNILYLYLSKGNNLHFFYKIDTRPRSAVGNVSGNRYKSDCRSRGREFDPFRGD